MRAAWPPLPVVLSRVPVFCLQCFVSSVFVFSVLSPVLCVCNVLLEGVPDDVIPKAEQIFEVILEGEKIPNGKVMDEDLQDQRRNPNKNSKANEGIQSC